MLFIQMEMHKLCHKSNSGVVSSLVKYTFKIVFKYRYKYIHSKSFEIANLK